MVKLPAGETLGTGNACPLVREIICGDNGGTEIWDFEFWIVAYCWIGTEGAVKIDFTFVEEDEDCDPVPLGYF